MTNLNYLIFTFYSSIVIEIDGDFATAAVPPKPKKILLPKKRTSSKKSSASASASSSGTGAGNSNPDNVNTIPRCFQNMQQRSPGGNGKMSTIVEEDADDDVQVIEMEDLNTSFSQFDTKVQKVGSDYQKHIREVIGIKDVEPGTVTKCVFVPKLSRSNLDVSDLSVSDFEEISRDFDIERLREQLNSVYVMGPPSNRCDCGLLLVDDDMMDFEMDFEQDCDDESDNGFCNQNFGTKDPLPHPGLSNSTAIPPETYLSPYIPYEDEIAQSVNQDEAEVHMSDSSFDAAFLEADFQDIPGLHSDSEREEPSPIFKRLRRSVTPGVGRRLMFDFEDFGPNPTPAAVQNQTPPKRISPAAIVSSPDSPDMYPPTPSPVLSRKLKPRALLSSFRTAGESTPVAPTNQVQVQGEPLQKLLSSSPAPPPPPPPPNVPRNDSASSDATCYESENSIDEPDERDLQLSPVLMRTIRAIPAQFQKRILFGSNKAEVEEAAEKENKQKQKLTGSQRVCDTEAGAVESPFFYLPTQKTQKNKSSGGSRKQFTFRMKRDEAAAVIPFQELLSQSPPVAQADTDITRLSPIFPTLNSTVYSNHSQPLSQIRDEVAGASSAVPLFETIPFDSDEDENFFVPSYRSANPIPASDPTSLSAESSQSDERQRRVGKKKEKQTARKRGRKPNEFVLEEAAVDGDESSGTEDSDSDLDGFEDHFVAVEESPDRVTETYAFNNVNIF